TGLTALLVKLKQQGTEINVAFENLDKNLRLSPATGASIEQIKASTDGLIKSSEELQKSTSGIFGGLIHGFSPRDDVTPQIQAAGKALVQNYQNETVAASQTLRIRELIAAGLTREGGELKIHA